MYSNFTTVVDLHFQLSRLVHSTLLLTNAITSTSDVPRDIKDKLLNVLMGAFGMYMYVRSFLSPEQKALLAKELSLQRKPLHIRYLKNRFFQQLLERPEVVHPVNFYTGTPTEVKVVTLNAISERLLQTLPDFVVEELPQDFNKLDVWCRTFTACCDDPAFPVSVLARTMIREVYQTLAVMSVPADAHHISISHASQMQNVQMATPMNPPGEIQPYYQYRTHDFHTPYVPTANSYPTYENNSQSQIPMYPIHMDNHTLVHKLNQAIHMAQAQSEILQGIINFLNQNQSPL
jgi:hypothetical protein